MNWKRIKKELSQQPDKGTYPDWKEQIAEECYFQCIYCAINEAQFGGIDHFHIEHYRPKSIEKFKKYENDIKNLYYSCPICNRFKSNDWPNDSDDLNKVCYPDPSTHNYSDLFDVNTDSYKLLGKYTSTVYMVERLFLNRAQLIYERREFLLRLKYFKVIEVLKVLIKKKVITDDSSLVHKFIDLISKMNELMHKRNNIRPYKLEEIRK